MPLDLSYGGRLGPAAVETANGVVLRPVRGLNTDASSSGVEQVCRTACVAIPRRAATPYDGPTVG